MEGTSLMMWEEEDLAGEGRAEDLAGDVERLEIELASEKERTEKMRGELGAQALKNRRLTSALAEARSGLEDDVLEENQRLKSELKKWKNIARHINIELIEHDKEVLNIMHETSRTRLAWERDLALNRQGLFASKLNEQHKAVEVAREETEKKLLLQFEEDLAPERKRREEAEAKVRDLTERLAHAEHVFNNASQVNKALADSQSELLGELERERTESALLTPRKVKQNADKVRKRNKELQLELEDLQSSNFEKDAQIQELKRSFREKERSWLAKHEETIGASTQTEDILLVDEDKLREIEEERQEKEALIRECMEKLERQASQAEKQKQSLEKQRSKTEKKLRKASKIIAHQQKKKAAARAFLGWRAELEKAKDLGLLRNEIEERKKQSKSGLLCTYFSMYHHRTYNLRLLKHALQIWRADSRNTLKWLRIIHKAYRKTYRADAQVLRSKLHLARRMTLSKLMVARKHPSKVQHGSGFSARARKHLAFAHWRAKAAARKLARDARGMELAVGVLHVQNRNLRMRQVLELWRSRCIAKAVVSAPAEAEADPAEEEEARSSEVTFVDKTLKGSGVTIKCKVDKGGNALQSILSKVQEILQDQLKELKDTIAEEVNRAAASGKKNTHDMKHKLQARLLQVDMTCGKLLEGLLAIGQVLDATQSSPAFWKQGSSQDEMRRVVADLKAIKLQAHAALTSLEGLDRKYVLKADVVPTRVVRLFSTVNRPEHPEDSFKAPEWTNQVPVFLPIE
ncbi:hypothetical protein HOP50_01g06550 [Chloropicon primus]|nr:hypothetical protein HOP50_01g06550 [Chloropicon primus]